MPSKKNTIFIFAIIAALGIGFIIGISVHYPKTDNSSLAGTVGKADKYRNTKITAKDVQLRSELSRDTARLKSMIREMACFSVITEQVSKSIDLSVTAFEAKGMGSKPEEVNKIKVLRDYSDFIRNNNQSLCSTVNLLTGLYKGDTAGQPLDIEKNLRDFGAYVTGLSAKNTMLNDAVFSLDNFMLNNELLKTHKSELSQLKSIRDQLLMNALQMIGLYNGKEQIGLIVASALQSEDKLGILLGTDLGGHELSKVNLGLFSNDQLKVTAIAASDKGLALASGNGGVVYDREALRVIILDRDGLQRVLGNERLQLLVVAGKENLSVLLAGSSLQSLLNNQSLNSAALGLIILNTDLGSIFNGISNLNAISSFLNNQGLGLII